MTGNGTKIEPTGRAGTLTKTARLTRGIGSTTSSGALDMRFGQTIQSILGTTSWAERTASAFTSGLMVPYSRENGLTI